MRPGLLYSSEFPFAAGELAGDEPSSDALPPEIAFLGQEGVDWKTLDIAARKARAQGVGADEVLIAQGLVGEDVYYRALAARIDCPFRTRWMKGWMQTLAVFVSAPVGHIRVTGAFRTFAALSAMICLVAGPLYGPFYALRLTADLFYGDLLAPRNSGDAICASLSLNVALLGIVGFALPNLIGMARQRIKPSWRMLLAPLYLAAMSFACSPCPRSSRHSKFLPAS
jgi:hypothetical protein